MPAATSKAELLAVFDRDLAKLEKLLDGLSDDEACWAEDDASIKAIIGHRIHWLALYWTWYDAGKAGEIVETPAPGFKWNQLKAYNAPIYAAADQQSWADLRAEFVDATQRFRARLDAMSEDELYTQHLFDWMNNWTLGRWAEASGPSHFRSAAKAIRKTLKANR